MHRLTVLRLSVASAIVVTLGGAMVASERTAKSMAAGAERWLDALTPAQRAQASLPFDGDERRRWHFIPNEMFPRKGLMLKDMTEPQRRLAHDLLKTGLSEAGYQTVTAIMELEAVLKAMENGRFARDKDEYWFTVFGTPSADGAWGWRVEGHHVSLSFTVVKGRAVASTPAFLGTNPAEVRDGARKGLRILAAREDAARALLESLDAEQRAAAVVNSVAPSDILTTNANDITALSPAGVSAAQLTPRQRDLLMQLIAAYSSSLDADLAAARTRQVAQGGVERISFAWAGQLERGRRHYYRVQGPTFLIEFDNTQNDGNHVHSVWRDFDGDFGRDLLREHLRAVAH